MGMSSVAAPVFGANREVVAAISVSGPSARFSGQRVEEFSIAVRHHAKQLTAALGGSS